MWLGVYAYICVQESLAVPVHCVVGSVCIHVCSGESSCSCTPCGWEWTPICGNSRVYDNLCQLKFAACTSDTSISPLPLHICGKYNNNNFNKYNFLNL